MADRYFGKRALITRASGMRYLPAPPTENDMFGWHHDLEDWRLKAMALLTDVDAHDQRMGYVAGSHRLRHPYEVLFRNRASLRYYRKKLGRVDLRETVGRAGTVSLFDSDGIHRERGPSLNSELASSNYRPSS